MKSSILFICGAFEDGKDGVGDYTRRLAGSLIKLGHLAYVLALHDSFVKKETWETQVDDNEKIEVLRLPVEITANRKIKVAREWVEVVNPNWISLQYVPFSFQVKGIPFRLSGQLKQIGEGRKWHIMFHELWTGMKVGTSTKEYVLGKLQRFFIFSMIDTLKPEVIHTQSQIYLAQLLKRGIPANYLPLFGNIPVVPLNEKVHSFNTIRLIFFGGIHPGADVYELSNRLNELNAKTGKQIEIVFIGRNGAVLQTWLPILKEKGITVKTIGEQNPEKVSAWFQQSQAGLFTTPAKLAEKSGSVAAMLEHELPVICVQQPWIARGLQNIEPEIPVYELNKTDLKSFFDALPRPRLQNNLSTIALKFVNDLHL